MTELEGAVLGTIWRRGRITAYEVRKRIMSSPTYAWSSSKGAIYPAIDRLIKAAYLKAESTRNGRAAKTLTVTRRGEAALRVWVEHLEVWMGDATADPVRTRINHLAILAPKQRRAYVERAQGLCRTALQRLAAYAPTPPAPPDQWAFEAAMLGAKMEIEARIRWLEAVRARLPD